MSFFRVTWNEKYKFATLHNWGCTFQCPFCSYKLKSGADGRPGLSVPHPEKFLSVSEQKEVLKSLNPEKVFFMGGEPTLAKELEEMLEFAKCELGAEAKLGHTNGSRLPLKNLDGANVGFKAWSEDLHLKITGQPKDLIYDNFTRAFKSGIKMSANMVYVPGLVELDEMEGLLRFLSRLDASIPFHIMGYIPIPGQPWRRPTGREMESAVHLAEGYLNKVGFSCLSSEEALDLSVRDDRFDVKIVAGA